MATLKQRRDKVHQFIFRINKDEEELVHKKELNMNVWGDVDVKVPKKFLKDGYLLQVWLDKPDGSMKLVTMRELKTPIVRKVES